MTKYKLLMAIETAIITQLCIYTKRTRLGNQFLERKSTHVK